MEKNNFSKIENNFMNKKKIIFKYIITILYYNHKIKINMLNNKKYKKPNKNNYYHQWKKKNL